MCIMCVGLYQALAWAKKDLLIVCNVHQVCEDMPSSNSGKEGPGGGF